MPVLLLTMEGLQLLLGEVLLPATAPQAPPLVATSVLGALHWEIPWCPGDCARGNQV